LFSHNHASNLLLLKNGDLLCAWFGGSREGKADISILCARLKKGAEQWDAPVVVTDNPERSEQNPILFQHPHGELWLLYTAQEGIFQETATVQLRRSLDDGNTWSEEETLFDTPGSFVRNPPVVLENGTILLPAYYCLKSAAGFLEDDHSVVKRSTDGGKTWEEHEIPSSNGMVHMSLVKLSSGKLRGFFRSRFSDNIYTTASVDEGITWEAPVKTHLPNNNASIQAVATKDGRLLMVYNHVNAAMKPPKENRPPWFDREDMDAVKTGKETAIKSIWGVVRTPLILAKSTNEGLQWETVDIIMDDQDYEEKGIYPEFSYPSVMIDHQGTIHVSFTYYRRHIRHVAYSAEKTS